MVESSVIVGLGHVHKNVQIGIGLDVLSEENMTILQETAWQHKLTER